MSDKHGSEQMAMTEACWRKFDFSHPGTSLLPAVTYTSIGQNNEDSKASGGKKERTRVTLLLLLWG